MRTLRPYQLRAMADLRRVVGSGKRSPILIAPTGAGKSTMGAAVAAGAVARGKVAVWFAHRVELIRQARETLALMGAPDVRVMTYQACARRGEAPEADVAIFDEAHHLGEHGEWQRVFQAYAGKVRVGLTATPERADGKALDGFDCLVTVANYSELIAEGHLVPCEVISPDRILKSGEIIARPVDAYLAHARGQKAIVFAPHVKAAEEFAAEFRAVGVSSEVVHGKMGEDERSKVMTRHKVGSTRVLCNVGIATEGYDDPGIACVVLARGCGSAGLFIQMTGRALRPSAGKTRATLLDLSGAAHVHGSPTEDRVYSLEGVGISRAGVEGVCTFCPTCGAITGQCDCNRGELEAPDVVGSASDLKPWQRALANDPPSVQVQRLAKWIGVGLEKGYKIGAAKHKFHACYKRWPTAPQWSEAERMARGRMSA